MMTNRIGVSMNLDRFVGTGVILGNVKTFANVVTLVLSIVLVIILVMLRDVIARSGLNHKFVINI